MGGTRDGEVYDLLSEAQRKEIERKTGQHLVPLSPLEAEIAKLIPDKDWKSEMFGLKQETGKDLEEVLRKKLKEIEEKKEQNK